MKYECKNSSKSEVHLMMRLADSLMRCREDIRILAEFMYSHLKFQHGLEEKQEGRGNAGRKKKKGGKY